MVQFVSQDHFSFLINCHNKFQIENYAYVVFCLNLTLIAVIQTSFHSVVYCVQSFREEGKRQGTAEETSPCPLCLWAYSSRFTPHYSNYITQIHQQIAIITIMVKISEVKTLEINIMLYTDILFILSAVYMCINIYIYTCIIYIYTFYRLYILSDTEVKRTTFLVVKGPDINHG